MIDENVAAVWTRIRCAAFAAAYLEMPHPDPAGTPFVRLVAHHEKRLWAEYRARKGGHEPRVRPAGEEASAAVRGVRTPARPLLRCGLPR